MLVGGVILSGCTPTSSQGLGESAEPPQFTVTVDSVTPEPVSSNFLYRIDYTVTYVGTGPADTYKVPFLEDNTNSVGIGMEFTSEPTPITSGDSIRKEAFTKLDLSVMEHKFYVIGIDDEMQNAELKLTLTIGPQDLE